MRPVQVARRGKYGTTNGVDYDIFRRLLPRSGRIFELVARVGESG